MAHNKLLPIDGIICEVEKVGGESFFTEGDDGADVLAACSIPLSAMGVSSQPNLLNVCSYPSGSPGSNPFDCVTTPGAGFIVIKKATTPQNSGVRFNFTISPAPAGGGTLSLKDSTSGVEQTGLISAAPGTKAYSVSEGTLPAGWTLNAASCAFDRTGTPATGTKIGASVDSVSVESGETTICTFDNRVLAPSISVLKTASPASIVETGDSVTFSVVVSNNSTIPVTVDSLTDNVFGDLNGQGTCNSGGNPFGSIAVSGSYTCAFKKFLSTLTAGSSHVDSVRALVSSDGGPASASDSARVTFTDVLPDITVTKSADSTSIAAQGGTSVAGFTPDQTFSGSGGGGGGGGAASPIFAGNTCDDAGANDTPEQSDLNCMSRADNDTGRLWLRWTWDDIDQWTGAGQTGDACALLDTDGDTNANAALCVRITNPNGDPNQFAQFAGSPILYKCGDGSAERCTSKNSIDVLDATSVCSLSSVANQISGGQDAADIQALCNLRLRDLGANLNIADIDFLNVCSFPSGSPTSNPFDCVVSPAAGFLVITEVTTPSSSAAYFAFTLRNSADNLNATATNGDDQFAVQGGATSSAIPMLAGSYKLKQEMPANWSLTSISCIRDGVTVNGTASPQAITIVQGSTTFCTFTNVLTGSRSVEFTVVVTNNSLEAVSLTSLGDSEDPTALSPTYPSLNGVGTCGTAGNPFGSIAGNGGTYTCKFSRTISGSPGFQHKNKVKAVGRDNENNEDTEYSGIVTVTIN